jgi:ankyrin repeat protein
MTKQKTFNTAIENNNIEIVKALITDKLVNPSEYNNSLLKYASKKGYLKIVKLLLKDKRVNTHNSIEYPIVLAAENNHLEILKLLLKHYFHSILHSSCLSYAFYLASKNGHIDVIKFLLDDKRVDLYHDSNFINSLSSYNIHYNTIKLFSTNEVVKNYLKKNHKKIYSAVSKQYIESIQTKVLSF